MKHDLCFSYLTGDSSKAPISCLGSGKDVLLQSKNSRGSGGRLA